MFLHYVLKRPGAVEKLLAVLRSGDVGDCMPLVDIIEGKGKIISGNISFTAKLGKSRVINKVFVQRNLFNLKKNLT